MLVETLEVNPNADTWDGTLMKRGFNVAVGQVGKGSPNEQGSIVGYGISSSYQGRGYATEMVKKRVQWAAQKPDVKRIRAETLVNNAGSLRVLEKVGFEQVGQREDDEGSLLVWRFLM